MTTTFIHEKDDWELTRTELAERRAFEREQSTHLTLTVTDELNKPRADLLWESLCRLFGLKKKGAGLGDPFLEYESEVKVERSQRRDYVKVTIPVSVILTQDEAMAFLATLEKTHEM